MHTWCLGSMLHTTRLEGKNDFNPASIEQFFMDAALAVSSTHHTLLGSSPGAAVDDQDMLLDLPYCENWKTIGPKCQTLINDANAKKLNQRGCKPQSQGQACWAFPYHTTTYKW